MIPGRHMQDETRLKVSKLWKATQLDLICWATIRNWGIGTSPHLPTWKIKGLTLKLTTFVGQLTQSIPFLVTLSVGLRGRVFPVCEFIALNLESMIDFSDFLVPNKNVARKISVD